MLRTSAVKEIKRSFTAKCNNPELVIYRTTKQQQNKKENMTTGPRKKVA